MSRKKNINEIENCEFRKNDVKNFGADVVSVTIMCRGKRINPGECLKCNA